MTRNNFFSDGLKINSKLYFTNLYIKTTAKNAPKKGVPLVPQVCGNTYKSVLRIRKTHVEVDVTDLLYLF
jgi:hypothetical protein